MNIQNEIYRRLKMHELLLHSNTGTPEELSQKLHVSKRQLYNLVDEFRAMGASIKYSRESKTYYYTNDFDLKSKIIAVPFRNLPVRIGSAYSNRLTLSREQSC